MIPVPQRIVGALQAEQRGDCYKCCIASILELPYEDVPHFAQGEPDPKSDPHSNTCRWLRDRDFPFKIRSMCYLKPYEDRDFDTDDIHSQYEYEPKPRNFNPGYWIATVKSRVYPQSHHAIVMHGNDVAFDPSPSRDDPAPYEFCGADVFVPALPRIVEQAAGSATP